MTGKKSNTRNNADPVYLQIYKQILRGIQEKQWQPGEKLPSDMAFARELGINHLTLKKALNDAILYSLILAMCFVVRERCSACLRGRIYEVVAGG